MNCENIKPLLSEFADERLDAATAWQVQTHLSDCDDCGRISRDFVSQRRMLEALPAQMPSARFDDALAQRLALTRRPAAPPPRHSWIGQKWIGQTFAPQFTPARRLRPALALGLAIGAGTLAAFVPLHFAPPASPAAVQAADPAFIADCVAQNHRDAAAEPLADLSAQVLAGSLDGAASKDTPFKDAPDDSSLF